jgi:hypothetical protein
MVRRPDGRDEPDWASKIHLSGAPVYYHNYLLGELMASQMSAAARRGIPRGSSIAGQEAVGRFFREHIFRPAPRWTGTSSWCTPPARAVAAVLRGGVRGVGPPPPASLRDASPSPKNCLGEGVFAWIGCGAGGFGAWAGTGSHVGRPLRVTARRAWGWRGGRGGQTRKGLPLPKASVRAGGR